MVLDHEVLGQRVWNQEPKPVRKVARAKGPRSGAGGWGGGKGPVLGVLGQGPETKARKPGLVGLGQRARWENGQISPTFFSTSSLRPLWERCNESNA